MLSGPEAIRARSQVLPRSYYTDTAAAAPPRPALHGEVRADVVIVGGGMTGCSAAVTLAERGLSVRLLEEQGIGFGASGRSGGQLIAGYAAGMDTVRRHLSPAQAKAYWDVGVEAVTLVKDRIARHAIECNFAPGYIEVALKARHMRDLEATVEDWAALGYGGIDLWDRTKTRGRVASDAYVGALYDPGGGHLHPLNFTLGLARAAEAAGAVIHEVSPMTGYEETSDGILVRTPEGAVRARWLLMAGNAYLWRAVPSIGRRIMPVGTYIIGTEPLGQDRAAALIPGNEAVSDSNFVLNYFRRSADHRLLFGGRVSYSRVEPLSVANAMRRTMLRVFPDLSDTRVDYAWGGYVAITVNRLPHFGRLGRRVLFAQGFSGHGVGLSSLAGGLMAEVVVGQEERFDLMARIPHLPFPGGAALRTPLLVAAMALNRVRDWL